MTLAAGQSVRTLTELVDDNGVVIPANSRGIVVGFQGELLVVEFHDQEADIRHTATAERWELRRA